MPSDGIEYKTANAVVKGIEAARAHDKALIEAIIEPLGDLNKYQPNGPTWNDHQPDGPTWNDLAFALKRIRELYP